MRKIAEKDPIDADTWLVNGHWNPITKDYFRIVLLKITLHVR